MALTAAEQLRQILGERIPPGGSDSDTLFSDDEIMDFLTRAGDDQSKAAFAGWLAKAAELSNLVDTAEGPAKDNLSQLHAQALKQVTLYQQLSGGGAGRTHIGVIRRPGLGGL